MNNEQHIVSVGALTIPPASFWATHNPELTGVLTSLGIAWYVYLGIKEFIKWNHRRRWPKNH